eukprot:SAG11_NODE_1728_length_4367_cov_4.915183_1_plen_65_part_10
MGQTMAPFPFQGNEALLLLMSLGRLSFGTPAHATDQQSSVATSLVVERASETAAPSQSARLRIRL